MTWTAPEIVRGSEPEVADERTAVEGWLNYHRDTLLFKCQGLTGEQLVQRPVPSSSLSLLGLVRHMAEVEQWWFRRQFAGRSELANLYCTEEMRDGDFDLAEAAGAEADFATFVRERTLADLATVGRSLDETFTMSQGDRHDLRWVYLHMIEEYARHNGHADLLRELIDGVTGD